MKLTNSSSLFIGLTIFFALSGIVSGQSNSAGDRNRDFAWTVIEYPIGRELQVNLTAAGAMTGINGTATVIRSTEGSTIKLTVTGVPDNLTELKLYALGPSGTVTLLGPVMITNGAGTFTTTTPLTRFMLLGVESPSPAAASGALEKRISSSRLIFQSAVPEGFAVIPYAASGGVGDKAMGKVAPPPKEAQAVPRPPRNTEDAGGERRDAMAGRTATLSAFLPDHVPMLTLDGLLDDEQSRTPNYDQLAQKRVDVVPSREFKVSNADAFILLRAGGLTRIRVRFYDLKRIKLKHKKIVLWAVARDRSVTEIGRSVGALKRKMVEVQGETSLTEFGLFVTVEDVTLQFSQRKVVAVVGEDVGSVWATVSSEPDNLSVKYSRYPYKGPWADVTTNIHVQLGPGARYRFICLDRGGKQHVQDKDCSINCEVKFVF